MPFLTRRWGLECCRAFFGGLGDAEEAHIAGPEGRKRMLALWERSPDVYDNHPLTLLRQEWWHAYQGQYRHAGFWEALKPGAVVLDYGCGVGAVTLPWIARGEMAILVDSSETVRAYVRHKFAPWGEALVMEPGAFIDSTIMVDALICTDVLEHLPNPIEMQHQLWARLKPGGHALLKMESAYPHAGHLRDSVAQVPAWLRWLRDTTEVIEIETYAWVRKPL